MVDVFIAYKRRLRSRVESIVRRLEAKGLTVWYDAQLKAGTSFSAEINEEVRKARSVLVLWSDDAFPHGGDSNGWVLGEATIGRRRGVLVPAILEPADLDPPWSSLHTADLTSLHADVPDTPGWQDVMAALSSILGRPELLAPLSASTTAGQMAGAIDRAVAAPRVKKPIEVDGPSDVFISYKRRTRKRVEALAAALREYDLTVWFDRSLKGGSRYEAVIAKELRRAGCVLVCWTNDAFEHGGDVDGYVTGEAKIGRKRGKLVPVLFEEDADLDPPYNNDQLIDLSDWNPDSPSKDRNEWQAVLEAIGGHVKRPGLAEYDRARAEGELALAQWAEDYPDDPLAKRSVRGGA